MAKRKGSSKESCECVESKSPKGSDSGHPCLKRLGNEFFGQSCTELAKQLLGKVIVRNVCEDSGSAKMLTLSARIVETEAYLGGEDKASHSHKGKKTERNRAMFMSPGTAYVYSIYGMYWCFNVSSAGEGAAVLIRAAEPLDGLETMRKERSARRKTSVKTKELCNGPSKLCQALRICKQLDRTDLTAGEQFYIAEAADRLQVDEQTIVSKPRVGIAYAEEWTDKPLRFFLANNVFVSVK